MIVLIVALYVGAAIALGLGIAFLAVRSYYSLRFGIGVVLWLFLLEAVVVYFPGIPLGVRVYPQDLVFVIIAVAAGLRWIVRWKADSIRLAWSTFGAVLFALFFAGLSVYGTTAGVEFRTYFYFWVAVAYALSHTYSPDDLDWVVRHVCIVSAALGALVAYRWSADAFGWSAFRWELVGAGVRFRVVSASQAHFLASALLIMVVLWGRRVLWPGWQLWLVPSLLTLVMLQHRSVWVVTLSVLVLIFLLEAQSRSRLFGPGLAVLVLLISFVGGLAAYGHLQSTLGTLHASLQEATQARGSTFTWRLQSWRELLHEWAFGGPLVNAFGKPFGAGYQRYVEDLHAQTNYSPHSYYVQTLLRGGLVGLSALLCAYVIALRVAFSRRLAALPGAGAARAIGFVVVGQMVFSIAYTPHFVQGIFLGVLLSLASSALREGWDAARLPTQARSSVPG